MQPNNVKKSIFSKIRNNFIAGIVVLIPIGITLYLTLFFIRISGNIIPKEINPNNYLPFNIPGMEILVALIFITLVGWPSLSFLGKKFYAKNFRLEYFFHSAKSYGTGVQTVQTFTRFLPFLGVKV